MNISIKKTFVIMLMSILTSGVNAQTTSTTKSDVTKISQSDSIRIVNGLKKNSRLDEDDLDLIEHLLKHQNTPIEGGVADDGVITPNAKVGDEWKAYISSSRSTFYLTYVVTRDDGKKFVGRVDIRID